MASESGPDASEAVWHRAAANVAIVKYPSKTIFTTTGTTLGKPALPRLELNDSPADVSI